MERTTYARRKWLPGLVWHGLKNCTVCSFSSISAKCSIAVSSGLFNLGGYQGKGFPLLLSNPTRPNFRDGGGVARACGRSPQARATPPPSLFSGGGVATTDQLARTGKPCYQGCGSLAGAGAWVESLQILCRVQDNF